MKNTAEDPHCLRTGTAPGLADLFRRNNEALEQIAKGLEEFLEVGSVSILYPSLSVERVDTAVGSDFT